MSTRAKKAQKLVEQVLSTTQTDADWIYCHVCSAEREISSLEDGACGLCGTNLYKTDRALTEQEQIEFEKVTKPTYLHKPEPPPESPTTPAPKKSVKKAPSLAPEPAPAPRTPEVATTDAQREALSAPYEPPQATVESDIERELATRVLCRRRLMPFIKRFRPKYLAGWVHEDICRRLERFLEDVEQGREPRLLLMMPPRGGKSEIGSRNFPAWVIGKHPDWEIIAASHTASLTMSFSRYIRDVMRDPAYQALFENTLLDPSSQSVENWNTTAGGGYLAAGVGTGITGRGAHILLLDDLVKDIEAADSQTIRDNTWEWYTSTAYTRLAPGGGVIGIMTWWNDDDWAGRIQQVMESGDGDRFEVIRYPAINDKGDEYILEKKPGRPIIQVPRSPDNPDEPAPAPEHATLTRVMNTALHPARYTTEAMLRIKRNLFASGQQRVWNALYQQDPLPDEGILFKKDMFRYVPQLPDRATVRVLQAWDFAITEGSENDYTVGVTLFQDSRDNLTVADVRRFRSGDSFVIVDEILSYAKEWDADVLGFEDGQIWKALESVFRRRCEELKQFPSYEILKPLTDKMVRASPLRGRMQLGKVYFLDGASWLRELFLELTRFPNMKHDDQVDALSWSVRLAMMFTAPKDVAPVPSRKLKSWKSRLATLGLASGGTHMGA